MLNYISTFENVHVLMVFGIGVIVVAAMIFRSIDKLSKRKSDDQRLVNEQQIDLAYSKQMQISNKDKSDAL